MTERQWERQIERYLRRISALEGGHILEWCVLVLVSFMWEWLMDWRRPQL